MTLQRRHSGVMRRPGVRISPSWLGRRTEYGLFGRGWLACLAAWTSAVEPRCPPDACLSHFRDTTSLGDLVYVSTVFLSVSIGSLACVMLGFLFIQDDSGCIVLICDPCASPAFRRFQGCRECAVTRVTSNTRVWLVAEEETNQDGRKRRKRRKRRGTK